MSKKLPTYSICNLLGADRCMTEFVVVRLREFVEAHRDLQFPHRHDFFQILLFTAGGGRHSIDFRQYAAEAGQVYFMSPGQIHDWDFDATTDGFLLNFNESFFTSICHNPHFVREFPIFHNISGESVCHLNADTRAAVGQIFEQMLEEFSKNEDFKADLLRGQLIQLLVRLSRAAAPMPRSAGVSKHQLTMFRQFERLIEQHFREKHLPKTYAELMFVTPNHLNALSNQVAGLPAGELIRNRMLLEAKRLLANSDLLISQIAAMLHFEDNAYFTRFFKKYTGATPERFRASFNSSIK